MLPVSAFLSICPNNTNRRVGNSGNNRNSDYARNKRDADAIVYQDADGNPIRLTREGFPGEEVPLRKAWSDTDYRRPEKHNHHYIESISWQCVSKRR